MAKKPIPIRAQDRVRLTAPGISGGKYRYDTVATVNAFGVTVVELAPFTVPIPVERLKDHGISYKIKGYYRP